MKNLILMFLCGVFFFSCQKKTSFNEVEKSFLAVYDVGDTLIFESELGKRDTVWILDKKIVSVPWDFYNHNGEYQYLVGEVYYGSYKNLFNKKLKQYNLLGIDKDNPDSSSFYINMRDVIIVITSSNQNSYLDKYKISDSTYLFYQTSTYKFKKYADYLYWNLKYGVVKFMGSDSVVWRRTNINPMPKDISSLPDIKNKNDLKRIRAKTWNTPSTPTEP